MSAPPAAELTLPLTTTRSFLTPYVPAPNEPLSRPLPFVTLTYATSLDSHLSLAPGVQTALSGPASKAMTHYLRTQHAAILIGASTAIADDPGLNSRLAAVPVASQPRPIVIDPRFRWAFSRDARVLRTAREGRGKAPYVLVGRGSVGADDPRVAWLEEAGGRVVVLDAPAVAREWGWGKEWEWRYLLAELAVLGLDSVMVEGGGRVANELLRRENLKYVDSVIVTVAPVYLGQGGVNVSPRRDDDGEDRGLAAAAAVRFRDVEWHVMGKDVVMAARPDLKEES